MPRKSAAQRAFEADHPPPMEPKPEPITIENSPPPEHLAEPEQRIWNTILQDNPLPTRTSLFVLEAALRAHQRMREVGETIARDGACIEGSHGQLRAHPLLGAERAARQAWLASIKLLRFDVAYQPPPGPSPLSRLLDDNDD